MKKTITLLVLLLQVMHVFAKPYTQQGTAYLYDYKTKTKKPVANVQITVVGAQPTISKDDGTFILVFDSYGLGDKISFEKQPYYQGMKVFNKKEVDNWFIVKDRLRLIMCRYEEFELAKNNFYQQGLKAATAKYEREIAQIKADQRLKEAEKNQKLQEAEEQLQQVMESLSESSEAMARIDQSEVDVQMQQVLDLYEKGDVDEAMKRLANMRLEESLEQSLKDKAVHQAGLQAALEDSAKSVQNIRSAIELYKNNYEWEQVMKYQKILADKLGTPGDLFEYAYYCTKSGGDSKEVESYYEKVLEATKDSKEWNTSHLYLYATAMNNLGLIYNEAGEPKKGVEFLLKGIEGRLQYAKRTNNPNDAGHVAWSLVSLGGVLQEQKSFSEAKTCCDKAEEIYHKIVALNAEEHEWAYGRLQLQYGSLYYTMGEKDKALQHLSTARDIFRRRIHQDPVSRMAYMHDILRMMANTYGEEQNLANSESCWKELVEWYQEFAPKYPKPLTGGYFEALNELNQLCVATQEQAVSEETYRKALEIYRQLAKENPQAYEPCAAMAMGNLANLYYNTQRLSEAEEMYKQAQETYQRLAKDNSKAYESDVAVTLGNLAILYSNTQRLTEAEEMYKQVLELFRKLAKDNPQAYESDVAATLNHLAVLYSAAQRLMEADDMYKQALEIYQRLAKDNPKAYEPYVAMTLGNLAILYSNTQRHEEAEKTYKQTLELFQRLAKNDPKAYEPCVAMTLGNLSFNAIFMKRYSEAEQLALEGLAVDSTIHSIASNLAASLLLQGRYAEAEPVYRQYKDELKEGFLDDFEQFKAAGVIPKEREEDVEKIKRILME